LKKPRRRSVPSGRRIPSGAIPTGSAWYVVHTYSGYEDKVRTNLQQRIKSMDAEDLVFNVVVPSVEEIEIRDGQKRTVPRKIFPGYVLVQMITLKQEDTSASEQDKALSSKAWTVVRNSPGVTGFVGSGTAPTPLEGPRCARSSSRCGRMSRGSRSASRSGRACALSTGRSRTSWAPLRRSTRRREGEGGGVHLRARDARGTGLPAGGAAIARSKTIEMAVADFEVSQEYDHRRPIADFSAVIKEIDSERVRLKVVVYVFGRTTPAELEFRQVKAW
jgi:transcription antitermination factor NusG